MNIIKELTNEITSIKEKIVDLESAINFAYKNDKKANIILIENTKNIHDNLLIEKEMLLLKEKISTHVFVPSINKKETEEMTFYELETRINLLYHNHDFYRNILAYTCYDDKMLNFVNIINDRIKTLEELKNNVLNNIENTVIDISNDTKEVVSINRNEMLL